MGKIGNPPFVQATVSPKSGMMDRQWMQWFRDMHRETVSSSELEYKLFGQDTPKAYSELVGYSKYDYVIYPDGSPQSYYQAKEDIAIPSGVFDPSKWVNASVVDTRKGAVESFVAAGYGSIGIGVSTSMGDINTTYKAVTGFDTDVVSSPLHVSYDKSNNGMRINRIGIWEVSVTMAVKFTGVNQGRVLAVRTFNADDISPSRKLFLFAGRNQDGMNISVTYQLEVDSGSVGDLVQLQIGSDTDTFTGVSNVGTTWGIKHISELKEAL